MRQVRGEDGTDRGRVTSERAPVPNRFRRSSLPKRSRPPCVTYPERTSEVQPEHADGFFLLRCPRPAIIARASVIIACDLGGSVLISRDARLLVGNIMHTNQ